MSKPKPPCLDCPDRVPACHDKCEKYQTFRKALDELNRKIYDDDAGDRLAKGYLAAAYYSRKP